MPLRKVLNRVASSGAMANQWNQNSMWSPPAPRGHWEFVLDPPAPPVEQVAEGTACSANGLHPYTFKGPRLRDE